jgi:hypothetical protein
MRDVVIWLIAVAVAQESEGAILIARDTLFHDVLANDEATGVGLVRIASVEEAVATLRGAPPPAETFAVLLLAVVRGRLADRGVDLPADSGAYRVSAPVFTKGEHGQLASANFRVAVSRAPEPDFTATLSAAFDVGGGARVILTDVEPQIEYLENNSITIELDRALDVAAMAAQAGLDEIMAFGEA